MSDPIDEVRAFLEKWKPFAALPPNNAVRESILRLLGTEDAAERAKILAKVNDLYCLHRIYKGLGILRDDAGAKGEAFAQLLGISVPEFAAAIRNKEQRAFLTLLLEGFEFDRAVPAPNQLAARRFLGYLWQMRVGDPAIKYSIYPNGVLFSAGGKTHDEMAKEFTERGFGSGLPTGGGFIRRDGDLAFQYDTHSTFAQTGGAETLVADSLQRWIRTTGADPDKVTIDYSDSVA
jgi:hypothetical protein